MLYIISEQKIQTQSLTVMNNSEIKTQLKAIQQSEEENNFPNGDLWNECENALNEIRMKEETATIDSRNFH